MLRLYFGIFQPSVVQEHLAELMFRSIFHFQVVATGCLKVMFHVWCNCTKYMQIQSKPYTSCRLWQLKSNCMFDQLLSPFCFCCCCVTSLLIYPTTPAAAVLTHNASTPRESSPLSFIFLFGALCWIRYLTVSGRFLWYAQWLHSFGTLLQFLPFSGRFPFVSWPFFVLYFCFASSFLRATASSASPVLARWVFNFVQLFCPICQFQVFS